MNQDNNSAFRLLAILQAALCYPENKSTQEVWSETFHLQSTDTAGIFRSLAALIENTDEIEKLIKLIPDTNYDLYIECLPPIRRGVSYPHIGNPWQSVRAFFAPENLRGLQFCADLLARHYPEASIPKTDLDQISKLADELFSEVHSSTIDPKLRFILLNLLETIRRCIAEYQIRGAKGMRQTVVVALDTLAQTIRKKPATDYTKEDKIFVTRFLTILSKVDMAVSKAKTYLPLLQKLPEWAESVKAYLPGNGGQP